VHRCAAFHDTATFLILRVPGSEMVKELVPSVEGAGALSGAILHRAWKADDFGMLLHVSVVLILSLEDRV